MFVAILGREIFTAKVDSKSLLSPPYLGYLFWGGEGGLFSKTMRPIDK